jgi:hypothetical protein
MDHSYIFGNTNIYSARILFGTDGHPYISDRLVLRRATALALALISPKPSHRATGYRSEMDHG